MNAHQSWRWTTAELVRLANLRDEGAEWADIATAMGRSVAAVKQAWRPLANIDSPAMQAETEEQAAMWRRLLAEARA